MENKKLNPLLIVIIVLLVAAIAVGVILIMGNGKNMTAPDESQVSAPASTEKPKLTVDENAGEYVAPVVEEKPEMPGVAIPGWGSITIPPQTTELANMVDFYNPDANDGYYYLTFELRIPADNEQGYEALYSSQLVPPGKHIQTITLSRGLDAGEYDAIIHVQPYTMDESLTPTNNADMKTALIVR